MTGSWRSALDGVASLGPDGLVALQLGELSTAELVLVASDYVTIALALAIAYVAFRGYDRNDSRPMLFIAVGFVLAFGGPGLVFLLSLVAPIPSLVTGGVTQAVEILGMFTILYGFRAPAE
jgi:hypothetical protein